MNKINKITEKITELIKELDYYNDASKNILMNY